MNKKFRALAIAVALAVSIPSTALAASTPAVKTFGGPEVVAKPDGVEIQYFQEYNGKIFYDLPNIIKTTEYGDGVKTLKYEYNLIANEDLAGVEHWISHSGAYAKVTNIVRESEFAYQRILYAKAPVTITFDGKDYALFRKALEFTKYGVDKGNIVFLKDYDFRTGKTYYNSVMYDCTEGVTHKTIEKPGLYHISLAETLSYPLGFYLYVAGENEDLTYVAPKAETATPSSAKVEVDGKKYTVPAYNINGENFMRIRDIAYILNGTSKQFNVIYNKWQDSVLLRTSDYEETPEKENAYTAVGGEMKALQSGSKQAVPSKQELTLDGIQINPLAYSIDGNNFVRLRDIGKIIDFNVTWDGTTSTIKIDTKSEYKGLDETQVSSNVQAENTKRLAVDGNIQ